MKISDAILKGCEMVPRQSFFQAYDVESQARCVMGTALFAYGYDERNAAFCKAAEVWPVLDKQIQVAPLCYACRNESRRVGSESVAWQCRCANDHQRWSRERIAAELARVGL